ncbi:hypothetical protein ACFVRU_43900 [Streptomyces sp. NPDC057927]
MSQQEMEIKEIIIMSCGLIIAFAVFFIGLKIGISFVLVLIISLFILGITVWRVRRLHDNQAKEILSQVELIRKSGKYDDSMFGSDGYTGLAYSNDKKCFYYFKRESLKNDYKSEVIPFSNLIEAIVTTDKDTLIKVSKGGLVGGALVGGIFGGVGSVVGAMSANKSVDEQIKKISFKLVLDDLQSPIREVVVIESTDSFNINGNISKPVLELCEKWSKRIDIILKRNEMKSKTS